MIHAYDVLYAHMYTVYEIVCLSVFTSTRLLHDFTTCRGWKCTLLLVYVYSQKGHLLSLTSCTLYTYNVQCRSQYAIVVHTHILASLTLFSIFLSTFHLSSRSTYTCMFIPDLMLLLHTVLIVLFCIIQTQVELAPPTPVSLTVTTALLPTVAHPKVKEDLETTPVRQGLLEMY